MPETTFLKCETRAQMRAFLSVRPQADRMFPWKRENCCKRYMIKNSRYCGMFPQKRENCFTAAKSACDAARNHLLRVHRHAFLLGMKGGEPSARLLLLDGGKRAWFSLFAFRDEQTALALLEHVQTVAAGWGAGEVCGPVSPDGSGFGLGALLPGGLADGAPWHPCDAGVAPVLEKAGFAPETTFGELEIGLSERKNIYEGAQAFAWRHGKITVRRMPVNSAATCRAAFACSEDAHAMGYEAFARVCGRIVQLCRGAFALIAFAGDTPAGWLLCAPEKGRLRLLHMQVLSAYRRGPAAAALLETAWNEAALGGVSSVRASTIDLKNEASLRMAKAAGGHICNAYGVYLRKISPESCK